MISIKSVLVPFRLNLKKQDPISLRVELTNKYDEPKLITIKFQVHNELSVEKTLISSGVEKKIGELKPNETKLLYFEVYPKVKSRNLDYPARLTVYEHFGDYKFVGKEYKKDFLVRTTA